MSLPTPDPVALSYSAALQRHIAGAIEQAHGWIGLDRYMDLALYAPGMGYYCGGAQKFGEAGDFVTAPEISPLFARTIASQVAQICALSAAQVIEVGAGSGRLAADLLIELEMRGALPERYTILDLSGELSARQRETIDARAPHLLERVSWLDRLPEGFDGLVLANELLDALPVQLVRWEENAIFERGVALEAGQFVWRDRPASGRLLDRAQSIANEFNLPAGFVSEVGLAGADWTASWGSRIGRGALLLIDYGFPRREYYHPQRDSGTLMCHYRHRAHSDPFYLPGLQDITAHVDFTAIVEAGFEAGLESIAYTSQSAFLMNCGITEVLAREAYGSRAYLKAAQGAQKLIAATEMGELFKVVALGKGLGAPLIGFAQGERSATL